MSSKLTTDEYIKRCREIHGTVYNYDQVQYTTASSKVTVVCSTHGPFQIRASNHYRNGCSDCAAEKRGMTKRNNKADVINRATEVHGGYYSYDCWDGEYKRNSEKMIITCPHHGNFSQRISSHLSGHRCKECGNDQTSLTNRKDLDLFISDCRAVHGNKYDYSNVQYINAKTHVAIMCPEHGEFSQTPDRHLNASGGCSKCSNRGTSAAEVELADFVEGVIGQIERNTRSIISPKELDIFIPSHNIAIEYCGLYWHSNDRVNRNYHKEKYTACKQNGIRLLTIFEDEWLHKKEIVKLKLRSILGVDRSDVVYARKTSIVEVSSCQKKEFLNAHHIQGSGPGSITLGLQHGDSLVAVMTFVSQVDAYVLNRYATSARVVGGFTKLLSAFCRMYEWSRIVSFADLRWSTGDLYDSTGFTLDHTLPPDYSYIKGLHRVHKFNYRRKNLPKVLDSFDPNLSETENCDQNGIKRIFDCGKLRYTLLNNP